MPHASGPHSVPDHHAPLRLGGWLRGLILGFLIVATAWHYLGRSTLNEARQALGRGNYSTSLRLALDDPGWFNSHAATLIAARSLSHLRYADEAEILYQAARQRGALDLESARDRAIGFLQTTQYDRAVIALRELLDRFPNDSTALRTLATLELTHGRMPEALAAAEKLAQTPDGKGDGLALVRDIHHEAKRPDQAAEAGENLLEFDPDLKLLRYDRTLFWIELTADLIASNRTARARDLLVRVVERTPDPRLLDVLATCHRRLGEMDQAEQRWRQAVAIDPRLVNPWLQMGLLAMSRKNYDEAITDFEKATALDPNAIDPSYNLARAYRARNRTADADRMDQQVEAIRKNLPPSAGGMGASP